MSIGSTSTLIEALRGSPLLTAPQQLELTRELQPRHSDPRALARQLLDRGWLTSYQVNQLFLGRAADLIIGPYIVLERLGEGGTGRVFKARHQHMNRIVALKVIRQELVADKEVVIRFQREIQLASQLTDPHVVHAYDAGPIGATYFLVMEYVEGIDLLQLVKQHGPLPVAQAGDYVRQAALGLQHIHDRSLVHRDIKPSNLLVTGLSAGSAACAIPVDGGPGPTAWGLLKILDLGLARLQRPVDSEATGNVTTSDTMAMGTLDYMAPEQALDFHRADIRADVYSLGCTFYYLLTGKPPFPGGTATQKLLRHQQAEPPPLETQRRDLPPALAPILRRMMAKLPAARFQLPRDLVLALADLAASSAPPTLGGSTTMSLPVPVPVRPAAGRPARAIVVITDPGGVPVPRHKRGLVPITLRLYPRRLTQAVRRRRWHIVASAALVLFGMMLGAWLYRSWLNAADAKSGTAAEDSVVFLSDLPEMNVRVHWASKFGKSGNLGVSGSRIALHGVLSPKGLGMMPPDNNASQVSYRLDKQYQMFKATAALNDSASKSNSPLRFVVLGDGRKLWESNAVQKRGDEQECTVSVKGVDVLELLVTCAAGNEGAHAVWIEPRVFK